jgi:hypothetical protein
MHRILAAAICSIFVCFAPIHAQPTTTIKVDVFGYRTGDVKVAVFSEDPGSSVQLRNTSDQVVFTVPGDGGSIVFKGADGAPSGDTVWWVDFSPFAAQGSYHLYSPSLDAQSYSFDISDDVYNTVTQTALNTFYLQRCNTPKLTAYAGDWADPVACHMGDETTTNASGHQDHGTHDLTGGWHDAGDYNKYVWGAVSSAILQMLRAYEDHPEVFTDGDLNIPESGNGIPDLLDEVKWELDWLLKMQLSDGSVLHQMHVPNFESDAPPSADTNLRFYRDPNVESAAVLAGTLALASRVFDAEGQTTYAATLRGAAVDAWTWLQPVVPAGDVQSEQKAWAAAEIFRADPSVSSAKAHVDGFGWSGRFFNPGRYDTFAALTYVETPGATSTIVQQMRASISAQVDYIFSNDDLYRNGMPDWSYHWGSNAMRAHYGIFLLAAAGLNETGSHTPQECNRHAQDFLHFFHGQNALSMTYLSNMAALGGEHSSWQFYHAWFGDSNNNHSVTNFIGKPGGVTESDYPYYGGVDNHGINDNKSSTYGPPPGFVPGGPNKDYSGTGVPPGGAGFYNRFYRDWNDQAVWTVVTWEITENSIGYQGPYAALASYFMSVPTASCSVDGDCDDGLFCNGAESCSDGVCLAGSDPCPGLACDEQTDQCFLSPCDDDGVCEEGEDCNSCPGDCGSGGGSAVCGNGVCEPSEDHLSCGGDCRARTGGKPSKRFTCSGSDCSNSACNADGWSCVETLPAAFCCGDGACSEGESSCDGCQVDCGVPPLNELGFCADGTDNDCDGLADCLDTVDCSAAPVCEPPAGCNNDGICDPGEDCSTCSNDCAGRRNGKPSGRFCCGNGVAEGPEGSGSVCFGNF